MQSFINFFMIFTMSLAANVSVYTEYRYFVENQIVPKVPCFSFGYHLNDLLYMHICITNKPPSVTGIDVIYQYNIEGIETVESLKFESNTGQEYYWVRRVLSYPEVKIFLKLFKSHSSCSPITVAEGMNVSRSNNEKTENTYRDNDICLKATTSCMLLVDLKHECEESADRQPSPQNVLIYVTTSVTVMCAIILVTYLCVKTKYCHRNSHPVQTMELNTYAIVNEVVYADLSLMPGDSQPPRHKEESPYAQIIGVMKPVDGKTKNK